VQQHIDLWHKSDTGLFEERRQVVWVLFHPQAAMIVAAIQEELQFPPQVCNRRAIIHKPLHQIL